MRVMMELCGALRAASARGLGVEPVVRGITLAELELRVPRRPRFCALSNRKLAAAGVEMPHWRDALARCAGTRLSFGSGYTSARGGPRGLKARPLLPIRYPRRA
jgi:hypothetical protein